MLLKVAVRVMSLPISTVSTNANVSVGPKFGDAKNVGNSNGKSSKVRMPQPNPINIGNLLFAGFAIGGGWTTVCFPVKSDFDSTLDLSLHFGQVTFFPANLASSLDGMAFSKKQFEQRNFINGQLGLSGITATFTGPRQTSLVPKAARPAAPCVTYCYVAIVAV